MSKYFSPSEFTKCVPSCSINDMDKGFLLLLDKVREKAGIPLVINSAYRSVAYDKSKGRSGNSSHCKGMAVDIRCNTSSNRLKIIRACLECGINRIGIGSNFIHIDIDKSLPQNVMWHYYN